jgi:hypothetical protein
LFCRFFLDSFDPYKPAVIDWPQLDSEALAKLRGLPFWQTAVETEINAGLRIQDLATATSDPLIREAIALNAFEERRHFDVLGHMLRFYDIKLAENPHGSGFRDPRWGFLRTGYGECFDSFFAFGLFALASKSGFFPAELVAVFEPVIQEEARHNLLFVNWAAYTQARLGLLGKPIFAIQRLAALIFQVYRRIGLARSTNKGNFTPDSATDIGIDIDIDQFFALCLSESERRFAPYDARLLRPRIMPMIVRSVLALRRWRRRA